MEALLRYVEWKGGPGSDYSNDVITWNDAPGRTQAEVVAALRGAAAGLS